MLRARVVGWSLYLLFLTLGLGLFLTLGLGVPGEAGASASAVETPRLAERPVPPKPVHSVVPPGYSQRRLHLKFQEGTAIRLRGQEFVSEAGVDLSGLQQVLSTFPQARVERLFSFPEHVLAAKTARIQAEAGRKIADFNLYYRIVVPTSADIEALLDGFNGLPIVEIAYPQPLSAPPPAVTPDFVGLQGYREAAPDGIDADFAAGVPGGLADRAKVIDIEYSWNQTHEDISKAGLPGALIPNGTPVDPFADTDHGTAVLGELVADDNRFGVTGLVPNASLGLVNAFNAEDGYDLQDSIFVAHQNLSPGDVMLIEQQVGGAFGGCGFDQTGCVAVEWIPAYYDAIVAATADGITVVEAAGNGNQDLDDPAYGSPFPGGRPDSGGIIVGAGGSPDCSAFSPARSRLGTSTFGSRVDLQGWGECVATTGYGYLQGGTDANRTYTASFGGTSSASPMVASAATSLSSALEEANGAPPTPQDVRARLIASGTPQDFTSPGALAGEIGPFPDLRGALTVVPAPSADLSIIKSDSPDPVAVSTALTYTLDVSNAGPETASAVTVADDLPASLTFVSATPSQGTCTHSAGTVTCSIGTVASGGSVAVEIEVTPNSAQVIANSASVSSDTADPDPSDNQDSEDTTVQAAPTGRANLKVRKEDMRDPVKVGHRLPYQIVVKNRGRGAATNVTLIDRLPPDVTFLSATPRRGTCAEAAGIVTCDLGSLAMGRHSSVKILVTPTARGLITNTVQVGANEADPNTANNQDIERTRVRTGDG